MLKYIKLLLGYIVFKPVLVRILALIIYGMPLFLVIPL